MREIDSTNFIWSNKASKSLFNLCHNNMSDSRPVNIHINPNLLVSSGSVHVNKKIFNVNQNTSVRPKTSACDSKIHYNPKFFRSNQNQLSLETRSTVDSVSNSKSKTIHLNPSFTPKLVDDQLISNNTYNLSYNDALLYNSFDSIQNHLKHVENSNSDTSNKHFVSNVNKLLVNPKFNEHIDNGNLWTERPVTKNPLVKSNLITINPAISDNFEVPQTSENNQYTKTSENSQYTNSSSINSQYYNSSSVNSQFRKVNSQSPVTSKTSGISKYKIRRNYLVRKNIQSTKSLSTTPTSIQIPSRKPRLSGSFKKIGQRKLVRKSMIQSYISSRRNSLPVMLQHLRSNMASRRKLSRNLSHNKYKFISGSNNQIHSSPKLSKFKSVNIPSKSKLKWSRGDARTQDFVKIGKRKIVRKSILQSILEARRSKFTIPRKYSFKKQSSPKQKSNVNSQTHRSRFKVIRNVGAQQVSQHNTSNIRRDSTANNSKKKDLLGMSQFVTSKSIFFRMPPSLRLKIRLEEKRKRLMLLKKVNNRKKCTYYNRFGSCKGLDDGTCKKLHDPKSISICRKFLKGVCDGEGCKLSHNVVPEKMPTCHQFLAGVCVRTSCPFLHVKLSDTRPVCIDFVQGFCKEGDSCTKRHKFICPEWDETGACKTDKCPYPHPQTNVERHISKPPKKTQTVRKIQEIKESAQSEDKNPSDDIKRRYFSEETDNEMKSDVDIDNKITDGKREFKEGINSVYSNESLLSFIPFS